VSPPGGGSGGLRRGSHGHDSVSWCTPRIADVGRRWEKPGGGPD